MFCCAHAAQIEAYLRKARWLGQPAFVVHTIVSTDCLSAGDALRLVDQRNCVRGDFVLVSGDTVSNMSLAGVLAEHRARRARDKLAILTVVTKKVSAAHRAARLGEPTLTVAVNPVTQQLLHYEEGEPRGALCLDASLFAEHPAVTVRTDLLDCHIDICAPEVLFLFTDNFDYAHVRRDFLAGTLLERELGNKIFVHTLMGTEYAARVHNLRTYDAVGRDIVQRWVYPFVPDANWLPRGAHFAPTYSCGRRHVYKEDGVCVARSAEIGADTVLGAGSRVGDFSLVRKSVVGRNCSIGMRCLLDGCHLMDGCTVGDHVQARGALICAGAVLQPGCCVGPGSVVSFDCVVGKGFTLPPAARLSLCAQPQAAAGDSDDELEYAAAGGGSAAADAEAKRTAVGADGRAASALDASSAACLAAAKAGSRQPGVARWPWPESGCGPGGAGFRWEASDAEEWRFSTAPVPPATAETDDAAALAGGGDSDDDTRGGALSRTAEDGAALPAQAAAAAVGLEPDADEDEDQEEEEEDATDARELHFRREVAETFLRCVRDGFEQANAVVELQGLKMAENRTFADLARYILTTLLSLSLPAAKDCAPDYRSLHPVERPSQKALVAALLPRLRQWAPLLRRFLKTEDDQVEMLLTFEEFASEEAVFKASGGSAFAGAAFAATLHALYENEVLSEAAAVAWAAEKAGADEADRRFVVAAQPFLTWLSNAEEDSSEESSEE